METISKDDVGCLSIACNTAHVLLPRLQALSDVPFISMIDETASKINYDGKKIVGLLGTPSTIKYALYQKALAKKGILTLVPTSQEITIIEKIIRNILRGKFLENDKRNLLVIANSLKKRGVQGIILGCTELPLCFPSKYSIPIYNSVEILAMALLRKYYRKP